MDYHFQKGRIFNSADITFCTCCSNCPEQRRQEMSEGKLDKRFGAVAIDKGFITLENLIEAMKIQILENIKGLDHRLIGQILWEEGYIKTEQINEVLKSMGI
jgi:hypothetical protein